MTTPMNNVGRPTRLVAGTGAVAETAKCKAACGF